MHVVGAAVTKGKTSFAAVHRSKAVLNGIGIWMGDHLDEIPCAVFDINFRLPPLLQMLYVDLNLTSRVSSRHSGFIPPQN